jgi:hypothetical protein
MSLNTPVINFRPSKKQFEAWEYLTDNTTTSIGYGGAAFSGKSYLLAYFLTSMCIAYPDTGWGLGRKELTVLKKTTLITLFKVFDENGIKPNQHYIYNQQLNVITFYNKSQIFLIDTAHQPADPLYTRFGGLELTGAAIDESAETHFNAIEVLSTRLGRRNNQKYKLKAKLLETFNPAKNHVYIRFYKPFRDGNQKQSHVFIPALPSDNPSPEVPEYIARILSTGQQVTIERLIHGNFDYDDDPSALIPFNKIADCFTNTFAESGEKYLTADIARFGRDKTVVGVWDGFRLIKIVTMDKNKVTEAAELIRELCNQNQIPISNVVIDDDGVGGGVTDILSGSNGFVNNSRPLENPVTKDAENYNNLKSQCYFKLAEIINQSKMYINTSEYRDSIVQELEQVKQYKMDKDGKKQVLPKEKVKELIGRSPDFSDMLMMRMYFEIGLNFTFTIK